MNYGDQADRLENAEATIMALLRNISALNKVVDVLLDHWGEDKKKALRGVQFICDHEANKQGNDPELRSEWRQWAQRHIADGAEGIEGPRLEGKATWE